MLSGVGISVRTAYAAELLRDCPPLSFAELIADNHLAPGGPARWQARAIAARYPVVLHCVGLSLGSVDSLDRDYVRRVRQLAEEVGATLISDHVAFTRFDGIDYHDLLPLPGTDEALDHLVRRTQQAQDWLAQPLVLENPSRYLPDTKNAIPEHEFLNELCRRSGCSLLLDLNNAYVSQHNVGTEARLLIRSIPAAHIGYVHIAGHEECDGLLVDSHGTPVCEEVWTLLASLAARVPDIPVVVEWDRNLPSLRVLLDQAWKARAVITEAARRAA